MESPTPFIFRLPASDSGLPTFLKQYFLFGLSENKGSDGNRWNSSSPVLPGNSRSLHDNRFPCNNPCLPLRRPKSYRNSQKYHQNIPFKTISSKLSKMHIFRYKLFKNGNRKRLFDAATENVVRCYFKNDSPP